MVISVGQALLILLKQKKENHAFIERLYLQGPADEKDKQALDNLLKDPLLEKYDISRDPTIISADPTRRYFETHLAFEIMKVELKKLNIDDLKNLTNKTYDLLDDEGKDIASYNSLAIIEAKKSNKLQFNSYLIILDQKETLTTRLSDNKKSYDQNGYFFIVDRSQGALNLQVAFVQDGQIKKIEKLTANSLTTKSLINDLNPHNRSYLKLTPDKISLISSATNYLPKVWGNFTEDMLAQYLVPAEHTFIETIFLIHTHDNYKSFSEEEKMKLEYLIRLAMFSVSLVSQPGNHLPLLEAYTSEYFEKNNRGRIARETDTPGTSNFGLLKGNMPVSRDDIVHKESAFRFSKPSDNSTFDAKGKWPMDNFKKLVHPFSASISGTFVAQIRVLAQFTDIFKTEESMRTFLNCFISSLLYSSGGHSLNEFFSVLDLPNVRKMLKATENLSIIDFMKDANKPAFENALNKAILYNQAMLNRNAVHEQLLKGVQLKETAPERKSSNVVSDEKKVNPSENLDDKTMLNQQSAAHANDNLFKYREEKQVMQHELLETEKALSAEILNLVTEKTNFEDKNQDREVEKITRLIILLDFAKSEISKCREDKISFNDLITELYEIYDALNATQEAKKEKKPAFKTVGFNALFTVLPHRGVKTETADHIKARSVALLKSICDQLNNSTSEQELIGLVKPSQEKRLKNKQPK